MSEEQGAGIWELDKYELLKHVEWNVLPEIFFIKKVFNVLRRLAKSLIRGLFCKTFYRRD